MQPNWEAEESSTSRPEMVRCLLLLTSQCQAGSSQRVWQAYWERRVSSKHRALGLQARVTMAGRDPTSVKHLITIQVELAKLAPWYMGSSTVHTLYCTLTDCNFISVCEFLCFTLWCFEWHTSTSFHMVRHSPWCWSDFCLVGSLDTFTHWMLIESKN